MNVTLKVDIYTKIILTVIALSLVLLLIKPVFISYAYAKSNAPQKVELSGTLKLNTGYFQVWNNVM